MFGFKDKCTLSVAEILGVATAVAGRRDLNDVIHSVSGDVQAFLTHDHFDAAILTEDKTTLHAFETGLDTEWGGTSRTVQSSPIRAIFQADVSYIVTTDAQADPQFQQEGMYSAPLFEAGLHARLHVAMTINGEVIGALSFSRTTATPYSESDVANALVVSRLISPYVHGLLQAERVNQARLDAEREARLREGLRAGARELTNNLEKTRAQIGMELHDQTLADLSRILRTLSDKEELAGHEISQLRADVNHCLVELRRIVDDARPSVLELFGMPEAVRQQIERESALQPDIDIVFDDRLNHTGSDYTADIEFGFYRIAQEAIHNAFKHSEATQINVALSDEDGNVTLSVSDNVCGLEDAHWRHRGGVFNMQTRAALFGANLEIKPVEPSGTHILLRASTDQMQSQASTQ
jgi:signal transduction histidine kinase